MATDTPKKRPGKRLLVASIGVATVTYMGSQTGCVVEHDDDSARNGSTSESVLRGDSSVRDASLDATVPPTTGNLLPPPPVGNLVPPPPRDAGKDATIIVSGNLVPPPPADASSPKDATSEDASEDAGKSKDGGILPPTGNLLPPPTGNLLPPPVQ